MSEPYRQALAESTRRKLRATAMLAEGEDGFAAAVLFHEAARAERRALAALTDPSPETELRSLIEQCACLMHGLDLTAAEMKWGQILRQAERMPDAVVNPLLTRLGPRFKSFVRPGQRLIATLPPEWAQDPIRFWTSHHANRTDHRRLRQVYKDFLEHYQGDAFSLAAYALLESREDPKMAWEWVTRALQLEPRHAAYEMVALFVVPTCSEAEARAYVSRAYEEIAKSPQPEPVVCFGFAYAALSLAFDGVDPRRYWEQAATVVKLAQKSALDVLEAPVFRLMEQIARDMLGGHRPDENIVYRAGLAVWVPPHDLDLRRILVQSSAPLGERYLQRSRIGHAA